MVIKVVALVYAYENTRYNKSEDHTLNVIAYLFIHYYACNITTEFVITTDNVRLRRNTIY
jgi:hypothetical protein